MPKYLFKANYTLEGIRGVQQAGGSGRRDAVDAAVRSVGGTLESFHFGLGDTDVFVIADLPSIEAATTVALQVNAGGGATVETVALLTPEQVDQAASATADYRPPGS